MKKSGRQSGMALEDLFWALVVITLVVGTGYVIYTRDVFSARSTLDPVLKQVPGIAAIANKPDSSDASPDKLQNGQPADAVAANPTPATGGSQPSTVNPTLAQNVDLSILNNLDPRFVPQKVRLLKEISQMPVVFDGKVAGTTVLHPGQELVLVSIKGDQVEVENNSSSKLIPAVDTDVIDRIRILKAGLGIGAASTPGSTPWVPMLKTTGSATYSKSAKRR